MIKYVYDTAQEKKTYISGTMICMCGHPNIMALSTGNAAPVVYRYCDSCRKRLPSINGLKKRPRQRVKFHKGQD